MDRDAPYEVSAQLSFAPRLLIRSSSRSTQDRNVASFQNLSTVAIFFSGVNASTIQYSYSIESSPLSAAVNLFWFISLILSAASAINSQFAIAWLSSRYRSPTRYMPRAAAWAITQAPMVSLGISACAFLFGLVCFAFLNFGLRSSLSMTISLVAGLACMSLLSIALWQTGELYVGRHPSAKHPWLWPYLCYKAGMIRELLGYLTLLHWHIRKLAHSLLSLPMSVAVRPSFESRIKPCHETPFACRGELASIDRIRGFEEVTYHSERLSKNSLRKYTTGPPTTIQPYFDIQNTEGAPLSDLWDHLTPSFKLSFKIPFHSASLSPHGGRALIVLGSELLLLGLFPSLDHTQLFVHPEGKQWSSSYVQHSQTGRFIMVGERDLGVSHIQHVWLWDTEVCIVCRILER